jgi:hypothetical protein
VPRLEDSVADGNGYLGRTDPDRGRELPQAACLNVVLAPGDRLTLLSARGSVVDEIRGRGPKDFGTFWSLSALGDRMVLQFRFQRDYGFPPFHVDQVIVGLPACSTCGHRRQSICAPEDFDDVHLLSVRRTEVVQHPGIGRRDVGGRQSRQRDLLLGLEHFATQLRADQQPLHRRRRGVRHVRVLFKYYRTDCNTGAPPTTDWKSFRCDEWWRSRRCLTAMRRPGSRLHPVQRDRRSGSQFGVCATRSDAAPGRRGPLLIGHPAGRPSEITHGSGNNVDVDGHVLRYYGTLDTEGGSSARRSSARPTIAWSACITAAAARRRASATAAC